MTPDPLGSIAPKVLSTVRLFPKIQRPTVTLQAGLPVANNLLNGKYLLAGCLIIFVAKLLATAFTFGAGGVGGLFVPSATLGAALGASFDAAFHPSQPGLFTLIGIAAFTERVTTVFSSPPSSWPRRPAVRRCWFLR
jgi:H+/Cl- antiporter ClcA